ncbi:hypothetical protein FRB99_002781 [Tulasnella sp. 403]|nr:hypothetical protein FRB99_002781 [Tulasnella sp. 403]
MSVTRSLLSEFRPLFRMLDDPFYADSDPFSVALRDQQGRDQRDSVSNFIRSPHVHMTDETDRYIVEAEVPGVRKENLDISIGDNGRSLTIKGNTVVSSSGPEETSVQQAESPAARSAAAQSPAVQSPAAQSPVGASTSTDVTTTSQQPQQVQRWSSRSSFARTIWLPRPVDPSKVTASLDHGILTLEIPKLQATTHRVTIA